MKSLRELSYMGITAHISVTLSDQYVPGTALSSLHRVTIYFFQQLQERGTITLLDPEGFDAL